MSEASKRVVRRYLDGMARGDPTLPELLSDDVTWWVPPSSPLGGLREGKQQVLALIASGTQLYDPSVPLQIEVEQMIAEGEWVAVQLVIAARTAKGAAYRNHYHLAFRVRGERICAVKEYVDTLYAQRMLFE